MKLVTEEELKQAERAGLSRVHARQKAKARKLTDEEVKALHERVFGSRK